LLREGADMNYEMIELPDLYFIGTEADMTFDFKERFSDIPIFWNRSTEQHVFDPLLEYVNDFGVIGLSYKCDIEKNKCKYLVGVDTYQKHDSMYTQVKIPKGTYLKVRVTGSMPDAMRHKEKYILTTYLRRQNLKFKKGPIIEVYPDGDPYLQTYVSYLYFKIDQ
jgi:predicted transcriptional regulator YdeE